MKDTWKKLAGETLSDVVDTVRSILSTRQDDLTDYKNTGTTISWNKTGKIPTGSADVTGDMAGNFSFDGTYLYVCVPSGATVTWGRVLLGSW